MNKILALAGAFGLITTIAVDNALSLTHTVAINAQVQAGCTAATPTGTTGFTTTANSSTFTTQVTGTTQAPAAGTLTFGNVSCTTTKVKLTLQSERFGLYVTGAQTAADRRMNYVATGKLNNAQIVQLATVQQTNQASPSSNLATTGSNVIAVEISFPGTVSELLPNGPLTAGTYTDNLTIIIDAVTV